jgi:YVTN family beta-propeller protein
MMITKKFWFVSIIFSLILVLSVANPIQAVAVTDTIHVATLSMAYDSRTGNIFAGMYVPEINDVGWEVPGSHSVAVISDTTHKIIKNITVDDGPRGIAYDSGKNELFVVNQNSGTVSVIPNSSLERVATISLGKYTFPERIMYDSGMGKLFVYGGSSTVWVISDNNNSVIANFSVGSNTRPSCLTYDYGKEEIFLTYGQISGTTRFPDYLSILSDKDYSIIANVSLGENIGALSSVYDSGTGEVYVSTTNSSILVISDENNSVVATIPLQRAANCLAYDSVMHKIFAAGPNLLSVISDATHTIEETLPLVGYPYQLVSDSEKGEIFVAHFNEGIISVISDSSNTSPTLDTSPSPSPTPSQSMPTNNTDSTLPVESNPSMVIIILAVVIVIVAVASVSLVYFKRRKGKP